MIVAPCPRCHEPFRLPSESLPDDAVGRCPWCRESFPVAEALSGLPPVLEVTSADGQPIAGTPADTTAGAAWGGPAALEAVEPSSPEPWFDTAPPGTGADVGSGVEPIAPMRVSPGPASARVRRKQGSKIRTLIGIALGPIIAVPLAGGILLALGRAPDLGFYPFDGTYSQRSPLRRTAQPVASPSPETTSSPSRETAEQQPPSASPSDQPPQGRSLAEDLAEPTPGDSEQDPAGRVLEEIAGGNAAGAGGAEEPTAQRRDSATAAPGDPEPPAETDSESADSESERQSPETAPQLENGADDTGGSAAAGELADAIDAASAQLAELSDADLPDDGRKRVLARAYSALARVGVTADPADRPAVAPLLRQLEQLGLVEEFGAAAPKWLDFTGRPHSGAVLVGQLAEQNDRWQMTLDSGRRVTVRLPEGVAASDPPQRVLALGAIDESDEAGAVRLSLLEPLSSNAP